MTATLNKTELKDIKTREDRSEIIPYNISALPLYATIETLSEQLNMGGIVHWHNDLEYICVQSGSMIYNVNGNEITLEENDLLFVNSQQLHGHRHNEKQECVFKCVLIPLSLLQLPRNLENKFINSFCYNSQYSFMLFDKNSETRQKMTNLIDEMIAIAAEKVSGYELKLIAQAYDLFGVTVSHPGFEPPEIAVANPWIDNLHQMIGFIQQNYASKISLQDIADAGNVCRSKCCQIFKDYIFSSPNDYLTRYRINKSIELLLNTSMSVTDIAFACGFSGSSYYAETFKKIKGCPPNEYRRNVLS